VGLAHRAKVVAVARPVSAPEWAELVKSNSVHSGELERGMLRCPPPISLSGEVSNGRKLQVF